MKNRDDKDIFNEIKLEILSCLREERETSDKRYAIKLVEAVVFALVGMLCVGVVGALINLVILK
jgi:hypothetical protein